MHRGRLLQIVLLSAILAAGCSRLPGLQVLTGQNPSGQTADQVVQSLNLVMADKSGATDPALTSAADRIEAADNMVNIIEVRKNPDTRVLTVNMLFFPPNSDTTTTQGTIDQLNAIRQAFEVTWMGLMPVSDGTDTFDIRLLIPKSITTLDHGRSFTAQVATTGTIDRTAAAKYLAGIRNLSNFSNLVVSGTLNYQDATSVVYYQGTPNHPMFALTSSN